MTREEATIAYTDALKAPAGPEKKAAVIAALRNLQSVVGNKLPLDLHKMARKELAK